MKGSPSAAAVLRGARVAGSVVHSRVAGHELTERAMRLAVRDGLAFKSVFEAKRADGALPERAFLEAEVARAVKDRVCFVSQRADGERPPKERCVYAETLPPHLRRALPRRLRRSSRARRRSMRW